MTQVVGDRRANGQPVQLVLPADPSLVRLARLVASALSSEAGFGVDDVEDMRIAVDELCSALLEAGDGGPLELRCHLGTGTVSIEGTTTAGPHAAFDEDRIDLSRRILSVVVDEHHLAVADGTVRASLVKRGLLEGA